MQPKRVTPPSAICPFCKSHEVEELASFGTTHAYSQFFCRACRTPFEWVKWEEQPHNDDLPRFLQ